LSSEAQPNENKIYRYINAIKAALPIEIKENEQELADILDEIESHLLDSISELANAGPITDDIVKQAIKQMGSPVSIAKAYYTGDFAKIPSVDTNTAMNQTPKTSDQIPPQFTNVLPEELQFKKWKAILTLGFGIFGFLFGITVNPFMSISGLLWTISGIILYLPISKPKYQEYPNLLRSIMNIICVFIISLSIGGLFNVNISLDGYYSIFSIVFALLNIFLGIKRAFTQEFHKLPVMLGTNIIGEKNIHYLLIFAYSFGIIGMIIVISSFFSEFVIFLEGISLLTIGVIIAFRRAYFKYHQRDSKVLNISIIIINFMCIIWAIGGIAVMYPHPIGVFSILIIGINIITIFFSWKNGLLFTEEMSNLATPNPKMNQPVKKDLQENTIRYIPQVDLRFQKNNEEMEHTIISDPIFDTSNS
jgi:hypothetical protein